jgi:putative thioredoxin
METIIGQDSAGPGEADLIKDSGMETFAADVLDASAEVPVIVDFWAPWCGPCKQLTPLLERVVKGARGAVKMVRVNIDENQQIAQQLRVQSIPAVFAFKNGQPVDGFMGALPESQIKAFVERLTGDLGPSPVDQALEAAAEAFNAGDLGTAAQSYAAVLQEDQGNPAAIAGLAKCYIQSGDLERAQQTLALTPPEAKNNPEILSAEAALALGEQTTGDPAEIAPLRTAVDANPKDHQARYDLAMALTGMGDQGGAIDELLEIIQRDRKWNEEAARKQLLTLFDALGPTDERTLAGRRKLSSILFS